MKVLLNWSRFMFEAVLAGVGSALLGKAFAVMSGCPNQEIVAWLLTLGLLCFSLLYVTINKEKK